MPEPLQVVIAEDNDLVREGVRRLLEESGKDRVGDVDDLVHALVEVSTGGSVIDPLIVPALVRRWTNDDVDPLGKLTPTRSSPSS